MYIARQLNSTTYLCGSKTGWQLFEDNVSNLSTYSHLYENTVLGAYIVIHCKSKYRASEFFHSYLEFDTHRLHLHLDKSLENQSSVEDLVFLRQFEMWREVSHLGWQEQHFHLDNATVLYSDSSVGRALYRTRFQVQPSVQYCCLVCRMQCGWTVDEF